MAYTFTRTSSSSNISYNTITNDWSSTHTFTMIRFYGRFYFESGAATAYVAFGNRDTNTWPLEFARSVRYLETGHWTTLTQAELDQVNALWLENPFTHVRSRTSRAQVSNWGFSTQGYYSGRFEPADSFAWYAMENGLEVPIKLDGVYDGSGVTPIKYDTIQGV